MIRNIIFDVGKVLIGWEPHQTMIEMGFSKEARDTIQREIFDTGLWKEEDRGVIKGVELEDYFVAHAPEVEQEIRMFCRHAVDSVTPMPYARDWITALQKAGYKVFVLSNFGEASQEKAVELGAINFLDLVDGYIFSHMVHEIKPEPQIYRILLERFGLKAEESVFLDDVEINITGAEAVGIKGILFHDYEDAVKRLRKFGVVTDPE